MSDPKPWPTPTDEEPYPEEIQDMLFEGDCWATDGCPIEIDGTCHHGHPSWPKYLRLV